MLRFSFFSFTWSFILARIKNLIDFFERQFVDSNNINMAKSFFEKLTGASINDEPEEKVEEDKWGF